MKTITQLKTSQDSLTISAHQINDENKLPFDPIKYSKFKFGCKQAARKFGEELAEAFISEIKNGLWWGYLSSHQKSIVVLSSPYCFIPTATFAMKDYFVRKLNHFLVSNNMPVVEETKIHQTITYKEDYGGLSAAQRKKLISNDAFRLDTDFCRNKLCIFLDDIRITGSHEFVIQKMIDSYNEGEMIDIFTKGDYAFLYYATLNNQEIPPQIENKLNYAYVKNLKDLDKIIKNEEFLLNTRVVKYILNSKIKECKEFLDYQKEKFLHNLYHQAIGNSYHLVPEYQINLNYIKTLIKL